MAWPETRLVLIERATSWFDEGVETPLEIGLEYELDRDLAGNIVSANKATWADLEDVQAAATSPEQT